MFEKVIILLESNLKSIEAGSAVIKIFFSISQYWRGRKRVPKRFYLWVVGALKVIFPMVGVKCTVKAQIFLVTLHTTIFALNEDCKWQVRQRQLCKVDYLLMILVYRSSKLNNNNIALQLYSSASRVPAI